MDDDARIRAAKAQFTGTGWKSDPDLRAQTDRILAMRPEERLRELEANNEFVASLRPVHDDTC